MPTLGYKTPIDNELTNEEFALQTIELLSNTYEGDGLLKGSGNTDQERLAAAFAFLQGQALEYLDLQMDLHGYQSVELPRVRVALYALEMIRDLIDEVTHPAHRLFRGLIKRLPSNDVESYDFKKQAFIINCVECLMETPEGKKERFRTWAYRTMRQHAELRPHIPENDNLKSLIARKSGLGTDGKPKDLLMWKAVNKHRLAITMGGRINPCVKDILIFTTRMIGIRENPLDLREASRRELRVEATPDEDGKGLSITPSPTLMARLAHNATFPQLAAEKSPTLSSTAGGSKQSEPTGSSRKMP